MSTQSLHKVTRDEKYRFINFNNLPEDMENIEQINKAYEKEQLANELKLQIMHQQIIEERNLKLELSDSDRGEGGKKCTTSQRLEENESNHPKSRNKDKHMNPLSTESSKVLLPILKTTLSVKRKSQSPKVIPSER